MDKLTLDKGKEVDMIQSDQGKTLQKDAPGREGSERCVWIWIIDLF